MNKQRELQEELIRGVLGTSMVIESMENLRETPLYRKKVKEVGRQWNNIIRNTFKAQANQIGANDDGIYNELFDLHIESANHLSKFTLSSMKGIEGLLRTLADHDKNKVRHQVSVEIIENTEEE